MVVFIIILKKCHRPNQNKKNITHDRIRISRGECGCKKHYLISSTLREKTTKENNQRPNKEKKNIQCSFYSFGVRFSQSRQTATLNSTEKITKQPTAAYKNTGS